VGGLALAAVIRPELALVGCGYLALTASYSLWLRRVIVVDIAAIAAGFVLRAAAGGVAAGVPLSRWFLVVTTCGAVFVVAGKRHAELFGRAGDGGTRGTLRRYSERTLRILLALAATGMLAGYAIWAFRRPEIGPWYEVGAIPVVLWLARYWTLVLRGAGEAPEELILRDRALLALTLAWTGLFLGGTYAG
jgi:decaprenyl-phosphate phosphoribosyltransferase